MRVRGGAPPLSLSLPSLGSSFRLAHFAVVELLFITAGPNTKLFAWGEGESGGIVLSDTTIRGLCGLSLTITH
jgi:hypothetical protein